MAFFKNLASVVHETPALFLVVNTPTLICFFPKVRMTLKNSKCPALFYGRKEQWRFACYLFVFAVMTVRTEDNDVKVKAETFRREGSLEEGQFVLSCFLKAKSKSKSMLNDLWMLLKEIKRASWQRIPDQRRETRSDELSASP